MSLDFLLEWENLVVSHSTYSGSGGILSVVLTGWVPIYLGLSFILLGGFINEKAINMLLYVTLGLMLFLLVSTCSMVYTLRGQAPPSGMFAYSAGGFFFGSIVLLLYNAFKMEVMKGPMDSVMKGDFPQKIFLLKVAPVDRKKTYNAYPLSVAIAWGIGLHGIGEGLLVSRLDEGFTSSMRLLPLAALFSHKMIEGLAIAVPIIAAPFNMGRYITLGAIAGFPLVTGYWLGTLSVSPSVTIFSLSAAAGIIFYGFIMLAELTYLASRKDINPVIAFMVIVGFFSLFFGLHLAVG